MADTVIVPDGVEHAVSLLADGSRRALAGGTWIMRTRQSANGDARDEFVFVGGLGELREMRCDGPVWHVGGAVTHAMLATLPHDRATGCLAQAAARSAFPAIRSVATLAGNLGARGFAQADLVPALLAADGLLRIRVEDSESQMSVSDYLTDGADPHLLIDAEIPGPDGRHSAYERMTIRGGGEYAVASAAVSVDLDTDRVVRGARVAFGAVEHRSRRCAAAEEELVGSVLDADAADRAGQAAAEALDVREDAAASASYRRRLVPVALSRAIQRLREQIADAA